MLRSGSTKLLITPVALFGESNNEVRGLWHCHHSYVREREQNEKGQGEQSQDSFISCKPESDTILNSIRLFFQEIIQYNHRKGLYCTEVDLRLDCTKQICRDQSAGLALNLM